MAAVLLALPPVAGAATYCVGSGPAGCDEMPATLQAAIAAAKANDPARDTIRLGGGTFVAPDAPDAQEQAGFLLDTPVDLIGSGPSTVVTVPATSAIPLVLGAMADARVQDLTVRMRSGTSQGLALLAGADAVGVLVDGTGAAPDEEAQGLAIVGGEAFRAGEVRMGEEPRTDKGVVVVSGTGVVLEDSLFSAPHAALLVNSTDAVLRRVRLEGSARALEARQSTASVDRSTAHSSATTVTAQQGAAVAIRDSLLRAEGEGAQVLQANRGSVDARRSTLTGSGVAAVTAIGAYLAGECADSPPPSIVRLSGAVIAGDFEYAVQSMQGCDPQTPCAEPGYSPALGEVSVVSVDSHYEQPTAQVDESGCYSVTGLTTGDPRFVSADDLRPRGGSPLIDGGDPAASALSTDLPGSARVADGNGDGAARADKGAFEYQRQAPIVTASVAPTSVGLGELMAFAATATDADGETLTTRWSVDDGFATSLLGFDLRFATAGARRATFEATDEAGITVSRAFDLQVNGPPAPAPTPAPTPPVTPVKDGSPPVLTLPGRRIRVSRRGVAAFAFTCQDASPPCRIAMTGKGLGRRTGSVRSGETLRLKARLGRADRRRLARRRSLSVMLRITATDAVGNAFEASRRVKLLPPRR